MSKEFEVRSSIICGLRAGRNCQEISEFNNIPLRTVYNVKKIYDANPDAATPKRKEHKLRKDRTSPAMVQNIKDHINEYPGKSMRSIARELDISGKTVRKIVSENTTYRSYALRRGQFLTQKAKERRLERARKLLAKLKNPREKKSLIFFSDEKNFQQDQKVNRRNNRWLCESVTNVPIVMKTKFTATVMVLGVVSNEGDIMDPYFFSQGLKINADVYLEVLRDVVVPWMKKVANGRHFIYQQDGAPAHNAKKVQDFLRANVPQFWPKDMWPPSSPDINPLDYYVWSVCERDVNNEPHSTIGSLKLKISKVFVSLDKVKLVRACSRFRGRVEAIIAAKGDFFEQINH